MKSKKEREKIMRDLVSTLEEDNDLHKAYKARVKLMIRDAIERFVESSFRSKE